MCFCVRLHIFICLLTIIVTYIGTISTSGRLLSLSFCNCRCYWQKLMTKSLHPKFTQQQQQPFNDLFSGTTWVSRYQKGKTNLDFTGARDSEWQWHQLGHMQVCTSLRSDNHASSPPLFFTGRMPFLPPNQQRQSTEGTYATQELVNRPIVFRFPFMTNIYVYKVGREKWPSSRSGTARRCPFIVSM